MSRSRKKNPVIKDGGNGYKKLAHKRVRANTRNLLGNNTPYDELLFSKNKGEEFTNQYDICDYKTFLPNRENWFVHHNYYTGVITPHKITDKDKRTYYNK